MKLITTYLGLKLRTPLVPSASPLSEKLDNIKRMEDAGVAAVVFHSPAERSVRAAICSILAARLGGYVADKLFRLLAAVLLQNCNRRVTKRRKNA